MVCMTRKELFAKLYVKLLQADVFDIMNYNCNDDLEKEVVSVIEEVFRDYLIIQGETLS